MAGRCGPCELAACPGETVRTGTGGGAARSKSNVFEGAYKDNADLKLPTLPASITMRITVGILIFGSALESLEVVRWGS